LAVASASSAAKALVGDKRAAAIRIRCQFMEMRELS
jgi:hypothetical protein